LADQDRKKSIYEQNGIPAPSKQVFFYNGELVKILDRDPATNTVLLYYYHTDSVKVAAYDHFQKNKRRAWAAYATRHIFDRQIARWERYLIRRIIPRPTYANIGNVPGQGIKGYYSEDDLYDIRDAIAEQFFKNSKTRRAKVLTKQELRAKIGDGRIMYVYNDEGDLVPIWSESV